MLLGEILLKNQLLSPDELDESIRLQSHQPKRLGEILVERGLLADEQIKMALQEQYWRRHGYWVIEK